MQCGAGDGEAGFAGDRVLERGDRRDVPHGVLRQSPAPALDVDGGGRGGDGVQRGEVGADAGDERRVVDLQGTGLPEPAEGGAEPDEPVGRVGGEVAPFGGGVGDGLDRQRFVGGDEDAGGGGQGGDVGGAVGQRDDDRRRQLDAAGGGRGGGYDVVEELAGGGGRDGEDDGVDVEVLGRRDRAEREPPAGAGSRERADGRAEAQLGAGGGGERVEQDAVAAVDGAEDGPVGGGGSGEPGRGLRPVHPGDVLL